MIQPTAAKVYTAFNSHALVEAAVHTRPFRGSSSPKPSSPSSSQSEQKVASSNHTDAEKSRFSTLSFKDYPKTSALLAATTLLGGGLLAGYFAYPETFSDLSDRLMRHLAEGYEQIEGFSNLVLQALRIR